MEDQLLSPASCYGITKHNQEELLSFFSYTFNVPAVALRFQNVYGPGQSLTNPYAGILSIFNTGISADNPVLIYEDGKETRDFVYIEDVVQSIFLRLKIRKALEFVPKMDLQEGLKKFVAWANQQPAGIGLYENMEKEMIEKGLMGKGKSA